MSLITEGSALGWLVEGRSFLFLLEECRRRDLSVLVLIVNTHPSAGSILSPFLALCKY